MTNPSPADPASGKFPGQFLKESSDQLSRPRHANYPHGCDRDMEQLRGELQDELMEMRDALDNDDVRRLILFVYLIPVVGCIPALWTLYRRLGDRQQQSVSRLSVTLGMGWLLGYLLLTLSSHASPNVTIPLLIASSLLTSSYFLINIGLMVQLMRRRRLWMPGISRFSDRLP